MPALVRGYGVTLSDPARSAADLERQVPGLEPSLVAAELHALAGALQTPGGRYGELDPTRLKAWSAWGGADGDRRQAPDTTPMFDPQLVTATSPLPTRAPSLARGQPRHEHAAFTRHP
ncbi:MAG: hypothetical protein ACR2OB_04210 [Solirubrobacteraceae bacterium]